MSTRKYDSTVARIASNLLSGNGYLVMGDSEGADNSRREYARFAVAQARAIVAEVERTEADKAPAHVCGLTGYNGMIDPPCPGCVAERTE